ncbi:MAG: hypothetical protein ABIY55_33845 [Kofleriaceae bacterium]
MARPERMTMEVPAAGATGASVNVFRLRDKTVQVSGPFTGSLQLEGSVDGDAFEPLGAPVAAPGFFLVPVTVAFIRVRTNQLTSGAPRAVVAGFDFRSF